MSAVDVLAELAWIREWLSDTTPQGGEAAYETAGNVRAAVAELIKCCEVTVKAFEALGRTDNVIAQLEAHRECERVLIEQKAALANVTGGGK